jgi:hypothetical protein
MVEPGGMRRDALEGSEPEENVLAAGSVSKTATGTEIKIEPLRN